jgi:hypothetical protein
LLPRGPARNDKPIGQSFVGHYYGNNITQLSADSTHGGIDYVDIGGYLHHRGDYDDGFGGGFWTH